MLTANKALSTPQLLILSTAAARADRAVMPLPSTLRARGASLHRLLESLLKPLLIEELSTDAPMMAWRKDEHDQHITLKLTVAGMAAVALTADLGSPEEVVSAAPIAPIAVDQVMNEGAAQGSATDAAEDNRPAGKLGKVLAAVKSADGATIGELVILTGWLPHTTRAALTRLRQRAYPVTLTKQADRSAYHLVQA